MDYDAVRAQVLALLQQEKRLRDEAERRAEARRHAINELERRLQSERDRRTEAEENVARTAAAHAEAR